MGACGCSLDCKDIISCGVRMVNGMETAWLKRIFVYITNWYKFQIFGEVQIDINVCGITPITIYKSTPIKPHSCISCQNAALV